MACVECRIQFRHVGELGGDGHRKTCLLRSIRLW